LLPFGCGLPSVPAGRANHDRLALKWKDPQRVIDRIVERVESRTAKGAAFRGRPEQPALRHDEAAGPPAEDSST
jgi:hypothetical protein